MENNEKMCMVINRDTTAIDLYDFISNNLYFNEVVELHRLLKYKMEYNVDMVEDKECCYMEGSNESNN